MKFVSSKKIGALAVHLSIVLTTAVVPQSAQAFDWISAVTTVIDHVKNNKYNDKFRKNQVKKYSDIYAQVQSESLGSLEFLSEWQEISAEAAAISRIADRYNFVHLEGLKNPLVDSNSLSYMLTKEVSGKLLVQCKSLNEKVKQAANKLSNDVYEKRALLEPAKTLVGDCEKLDQFLIPEMAQALFNPLGQRDILAKFTAESRDEFAGMLNAQLTKRENNSILVQTDGSIVRQVPSRWGSAALTNSKTKSLTKKQVREIPTFTSRHVIRAINGYLLDIKSSSSSVLAFNDLYLKKLFESSKKAQEQYLALIGADASKLAEAKYPTKSWVDIIEDVIDKVDSDD